MGIHAHTAASLPSHPGSRDLGQRQRLEIGVVAQQHFKALRRKVVGVGVNNAQSTGYVVLVIDHLEFLYGWQPSKGVVGLAGWPPG